MTSEGSLRCSACREIQDVKFFTSNQLKKGAERRCALCVRSEREDNETRLRQTDRAGSAENRPAPTPVWGTSSITIGDKFEVWLPKGSMEHDRREWVARDMTTQEFLPRRLALTAPYYASRVTKDEGKWISVHVTSAGKLQAMGELDKPPLDESTLPEALRGPPPAAGAARTGESYAGVVAARPSGPSDRRITITAYAPEKATNVYLEETNGSGGCEDLTMLSPCCWQTKESLPCPPAPSAITYRVVVETPGLIYGTNKDRSDECRIPGRTYQSPQLDHIVNLSPGIDADGSSIRDRGMKMVDALLRLVYTNPAAFEVTAQTIDSILQCGSGDYSDYVNKLLKGSLNAPAFET